MVKIDVKDKKILYQLDLNSRQSFRSIARNVDLSKNSVISRVNRLKESGVIYSFYTFINSYKLGYTLYRCYFVFQYASREIKDEIINYFVNNKYTIFITLLEGQYNFSVFFAVDDIHDFHNFWDITLNKYRDYFAEMIFSIYCGKDTYSYSFLTEKEDIQKADKKRVISYGTSHKVKIDNTDLSILNIIAQNSRIPTTKIGNQLNITTSTVRARILKLKKLGVIGGFLTEIAVSKLGYNAHGKLDIYLKNLKNKYQIVNHIINGPNIRCHYKTPIGYPADLEFEICFKNNQQVYQFIEDISLKFPDSIKNYKFFTALKRYKYRYIPEIALE